MFRYVSFDESEHWSDLQLNMPVISVWDVDRWERSCRRNLWLFLLVEDANLAGTSVGQNPPVGALIDFFLKAKPKQDIMLVIYGAKGNPRASV